MLQSPRYALLWQRKIRRELRRGRQSRMMSVRVSFCQWVWIFKDNSKRAFSFHSLSYLWYSLYSRELIQREVKGKRKQTLLQSTSLTERRTILLKRVQRFRELQQVYMPGLDAPLLTQLERAALPRNSTSIHVEDSILFMPSELSAATCRRVCSPGLGDIEDRIRFAEAHDALDHLRHHLHNRTFTNKFKIQNVTGQKGNTRAHKVQHRIDDRVKAAQVQYCRAQTAVMNL